MTEEERSIVKKAVMYDLRLLIKNDQKTQYTKEEILDLFDTIVMAKSQDS